MDKGKVFTAINDTIKKYDNVIIAGHKDPDLDSLGSALGLYEIVENLGINCCLFFNNIKQYNSNVAEALDKISKDIKIVNESSYKKINGKTVLILTDLHISSRLECPNIIHNYDVIVLDHHIKSKDYIKKAKYIYINSNLSSMSEFVTFYANYNNTVVDSVISTIMLGGIEIDTNDYNLKTSYETYDAASLLMKWGADTILKQELLKETKEEYVKRASFIKNSYMVNDNTAMCVINGVTNNLELAQTAEELLNFEDVKASFVIGRLEDKKIGVSARSLGDIDVSAIIKQLGGGGHTSNAACQVENSTIKDIKQNIIDLVNQC